VFGFIGERAAAVPHRMKSNRISIPKRTDGDVWMALEDLAERAGILFVTWTSGAANGFLGMDTMSAVRFCESLNYPQV
jgi:hypothetical protein